MGRGRKNSTLDEESKSRSDLERFERWGKEDREAKSLLSRASILPRIFVRTRELYLRWSKAKADVAHGMSERERVGRKRTKESSVDAEEVVERARIPGKHGKVGN